MFKKHFVNVCSFPKTEATRKMQMHQTAMNLILFRKSNDESTGADGTVFCNPVPGSRPVDQQRIYKIPAVLDPQTRGCQRV